MKLSRIAILSLAAAMFVGLTGMLGDSMHPALPNPQWRAERAHRRSAPQARYITEFAGELVLVGVVAALGRVVLRLRLSPASRREGQPILLDLHRARSDC